MTDEVQGAPEGAPVDTPESQAPVRPDNIPEKFWDAEKGAVNTEALLASYTELEKARSKPADETPADGTEPEVKPLVPPEVAATEAYKATVEKATAELQGEAGAISDETYEAFAKQGISREQIDTHVEGQVAMFELRKIYAEREVGGEEAYSSLLSWAGSNYTPEEAQAFNDSVFGSNRDEAMKSVRALKARYEDAMGTDGKIITSGTGSAVTGGYTSKAEWLSDIRKPEYKKDPAVREAVRRKLESAMKNGVDMGVGVSYG